MPASLPPSTIRYSSGIGRSSNQHSRISLVRGSGVDPRSIEVRVDGRLRTAGDFGVRGRIDEHVAVSRAQRRLYVIGDRSSWAEYNYFHQLAGALPPTAQRMPVVP